MANIVKKILNSDTYEYISKLSSSELEEVIIYTSDKYYNSEPVITDAQYDILIDFLQIRNPKSLVLKNIGAKIKIKNKVKLDYWLGSMDKIKPPSCQLENWIKKYNGPYNLSDKLDGVSALLIYTHDGQIKMCTRGTATEGLNITPLVKYLDLPSFDIIQQYCKKNTIKGSINLIAFRGELIIKEKVFEKKWSDVLKNGRNSVAGLVNSKKINPKLANDTNLVLYEVVEPFYSLEKQFKIINDIGFNIVINKSVNELSYEILSKYFKERRAKSEYQIDGIIVSAYGSHKRNIDGNPEYAFAFKDILEDQKAITTVISVEWNISKDGLIKPTVLLEPVLIGGVEIKRVTGYNAKYIVDNKIGSGATIELIRSGDVIPKIEKIIKIGKVELPDVNFFWNETNVDIILNNYKDNNDVTIKNIYYFFSKLETKGLGIKNIEKMVNCGLDSVVKILAANKNKFLTVDNFGEKTASNLVESIKQAVSNVSIEKIMAASNKLGHGMGEERIKQVLLKYPKLLTDYKKWSKKEFIDNLKQINGWEEKTATLFVNNFNEFIIFYNSILKYISVKEKENKKNTGYFTNKIIVFSGFRDKELEEKIIIQNGKIGTSISKNTDFLIVKDQVSINSPTDKISKALSLEIKIITKDKIIKLLD